MPESRSTFRLYLATVPGDMDGERVVLERLVLPELRERAAGMGIEIALADPNREGWDLARRFQEIDACRPFFLAFLGERYGEAPGAVPLQLVAAHPWLAEDPGRSVLELEIRYGALRDPAGASGCFFYFRDPAFPSMVPVPRRGGFLAESEDAAGRLSRLKERIRTSGRPVFDGYPCGWSDSLGRASRLDALAERIIEDLWQAIQDQERPPARVAPIAAAPPPPEPLPEPRAAAHLPPEKPLAVQENVQFTVYRPKAVEPMKWYPLLAFAHLAELPEDAPADEPDPLEKIREQARRVLGDLVKGYADVKQDSRYAVPHEAEITFLPEIPGFEINPPRRTFLWLESVQREEFRIRAGPQLDGTLVRGRMSVFWGSILLAEISLGIRVDSRVAGAAQPAPERLASRPFRNIFPSYSHRDAGIVEEFERYARTLGDRYLRDVTQLRAGEVWNDRLKELIRQADVFQLFWSRNAIHSPYVEEEWRYALSLGRYQFVRPTYWEDPLPEDPARNLPPDDLRRLHFQLLSTGGASPTTPHGPALPAPTAAPPAADRTHGFDPNATIFAPAAVPPRPREQAPPPAAAPAEMASFREPPPPDDMEMEEASPALDLDDTAVSFEPELDLDLDDTGAGAAPPALPPLPQTAPARRAAVPAPPPLPFPASTPGIPAPQSRPAVSGRGGGLKIAAMLVTVVLGLSIFVLRSRHPAPQAVGSGAPAPTVAAEPPTLGSPNVNAPPPGSPPDVNAPPPQDWSETAPQEFETYDAATWQALTTHCELSGEEVSRLPSRAAPGTPMVEVFSSPSSFNARLIQRQLESLGAFLLPRGSEESVACMVVLDPSQPAAQEYVRSLRNEPRVVPFPRIPQ